MAAYDEAVAIDKRCLRAHCSKIAALQRGRKFMQAFAACRAGLSALPENAELLRLRDGIHRAYKENKEVVKQEEQHRLSEVRARLRESGFYGDEDRPPSSQTVPRGALLASQEKQRTGDACPGSSTAASDAKVMDEVQTEMKKWRGRNPSEKERLATKATLMATFRKLYAKTGS